jgi:hypothetical protein
LVDDRCSFDRTREDRGGALRTVSGLSSLRGLDFFVLRALVSVSTRLGREVGLSSDVVRLDTALGRGE